MVVSSATTRVEMPAYIHHERCWPEVNRLSPCELACPLHMDVPDYVVAIAKGNPAQALAIIRDTNPLPSVCGRVCHHPCEDECNRKVIDTPIAIEWLKRYAADNGNTQKPTQVPRTKVDRVAIVGSGPAGLTAAYDLVRKGYGVTVFEAAPVAGGILSSAIPSFILEPEAVQADIDYIRALGVRIHTNVRVGKDLGLASLSQQGYKAILVATGLQKSAELKIPGFNLPGVLTAMPFLKAVKVGEAPRLSGKVWVIGGGGVALDVARTAVRLGAFEVHLACLESRENMPGFKWEIEAAEKEGVRMHPALSPQQFVEKDGKLSGIAFKRVTSTYFDNEGRLRWTLMEGAGSDYAVEADMVIVAIGQAPDMADMMSEGLDMSKTGGILANKGTLETNIPGIFAAGDISGTGRTVTEAMAAGRRAATSIDQYLSRAPITEVRENREAILIKQEQVPAFFLQKERPEMPRISAKESVKTFHEADLGYRDWQAVEEARRCLNCRMCANCIFERGQLCFETASRLL